MPESVAWFGLILASLVVSLGTAWAFQRGAHDFSVFYESWRLVLSGQGANIYHGTPDRFLYAPGFAWIFAPLGYLPREVALAFWCFGKAAVIGFLIRGFGLRLAQGVFPSVLGVGAWAVLLCARPILIDFQYGQVNIFVLGACAWALLMHFRKSAPDHLDFLSWFVLGGAGFVKLFPLPLLLIPLFVTRYVSVRRVFLERLGALAGIAAVALIPVVSQGFQGTKDLYLQWQEALIGRGLPLESHNQSFSAFLSHYFSGSPTHVIANGVGHPAVLGGPWFSVGTINSLTVAWTLIALGLLLGWILTGTSKSPLRWLVVTIGALIVPSHLVWKPYFVMGLPMTILAVASWRRLWPYLLGIFLLTNFSGFDWVGPVWGARLEAGSLQLWLHLILMGLVIREAVVESSLT
jgi:hypothetical protein